MGRVLVTSEGNEEQIDEERCIGIDALGGMELTALNSLADFSYVFRIRNVLLTGLSGELNLVLDLAMYKTRIIY